MKKQNIVVIAFSIMTLFGYGPFLFKSLAEDSGGFVEETMTTSESEVSALSALNDSERQIKRMRVVNMRSVVGSVNTATAISVTNLGNKDCRVSVDWFRAKIRAADCNTSLIISAGQQRTFCSRLVSNDVFELCDETCDPELTFNQGHAIVNSDKSKKCRNLAVSPRIFYTNRKDSTVLGVSNPKVVILKGNRGE